MYYGSTIIFERTRKLKEKITTFWEYKIIICIGENLHYKFIIEKKKSTK